MTDDLPHAIRRQRWTVVVGSEKLALALRSRFGDSNRLRWLPRIEAVLEAHDTPGRHLRLSRLDLDLGTVAAPRLDGPSLEAFERSVGDRLETHLRRELRRRLDASAATAGGYRSGADLEVLPDARVRVELFEHVLLRGTLPYWAPRRGFRFTELLRRAMESMPTEVEQLIRRHGHRQRVLRRLVAQLDSDTFHDLLHLLEPEHGALLIAYLLDIGRLHRLQPLVPLGAQRLEQSLAVLTLAYLVNQRGSRFNRKSYVRSLIRSLARGQGLFYADLLRTFGRCLQRASWRDDGSSSRSLLRSSLPDLLRELLAELDDGGSPMTSRGAERRSADLLCRELLDRLPSSLVSAASERGASAAAEPGLSEMLLALTEHHPPSARRFLESLRLRHAERRAVARESSPEIFERMLGILAPDDADGLGELVSALGRVPAPYRPRAEEIREAVLAEVLHSGVGRPFGEEAFARILHRLFESPLPRPVARSLDREIRAVPAHLPDASRAALRRAVARVARHGTDGPIDAGTGSASSRRSMSAHGGRERLPDLSGASSRRQRNGSGKVERPARRRSSGAGEADAARLARGGARPESASAPGSAAQAAEDEALYLDNAGLVLIGPFLPRLLDQLDVLHNGRIRDLFCASCAVHLMQYLVDGRLDASEPELVLPKVLCGWPLEEPVLARFEPGEGHLALCDDLLASVTGCWPSFGGSSVAALRETFLQREGRLVTTETEHRLEVSRSTFDVLMRDRPWSFAVLFHGAMDRPLHVSWQSPNP